MKILKSITVIDALIIFGKVVALVAMGALTGLIIFHIIHGDVNVHAGL